MDSCTAHTAEHIYDLPLTPQSAKKPLVNWSKTPKTPGVKCGYGFKAFFAVNKTTLSAKLPFLTATQIKRRAAEDWSRLGAEEKKNYQPIKPKSLSKSKVSGKPSCHPPMDDPRWSFDKDMASLPESDVMTEKQWTQISKTKAKLHTSKKSLSTFPLKPPRHKFQAASPHLSEGTSSQELSVKRGVGAKNYSEGAHWPCSDVPIVEHDQISIQNGGILKTPGDKVYTSTRVSFSSGNKQIVDSSRKRRMVYDSSSPTKAQGVCEPRPVPEASSPAYNVYRFEDDEMDSESDEDKIQRLEQLHQVVSSRKNGNKSTNGRDVSKLSLGCNAGDSDSERDRLLAGIDGNRILQDIDYPQCSQEDVNDSSLLTNGTALVKTRTPPEKRKSKNPWNKTKAMGRKVDTHKENCGIRPNTNSSKKKQQKSRQKPKVDSKISALRKESLRKVGEEGLEDPYDFDTEYDDSSLVFSRDVQTSHEGRRTDEEHNRNSLNDASKIQIIKYDSHSQNTPSIQIKTNEDATVATEHEVSVTERSLDTITPQLPVALLELNSWKVRLTPKKPKRYQNYSRGQENRGLSSKQIAEVLKEGRAEGVLGPMNTHEDHKQSTLVRSKTLGSKMIKVKCVPEGQNSDTTNGHRHWNQRKRRKGNSKRENTIMNSYLLSKEGDAAEDSDPSESIPHRNCTGNKSLTLTRALRSLQHAGRHGEEEEDWNLNDIDSVFSSPRLLSPSLSGISELSETSVSLQTKPAPAPAALAPSLQPPLHPPQSQDESHHSQDSGYTAEAVARLPRPDRETVGRRHDTLTTENCPSVGKKVAEDSGDGLFEQLFPEKAQPTKTESNSQRFVFSNQEGSKSDFNLLYDSNQIFM